MLKPDLHLHSTASDGVLSPEELCKKACCLDVDVMAITDHDTFQGYEQLAGEALPLTLIQGAELSLRDRKNMHLLCYGVHRDTPLHAAVLDLAQKRTQRADQMLDLLHQAGMPLDRQQLLQSAQGSIGRPHIARAMVAQGYVHNLHEAFERFLGDGKPCYVGGERLSLTEALVLCRESRFIPVLAHPYEMGLSLNTLSLLLPEWQRQGLMGLEVYHPSAQGKGFAGLEHLARSHGLLITGGSDFHQEGDHHGLPGCTAAAWQKSGQDIEKLLQAMQDA